MDRTHLIALLKQAFDRPIAFHRCFVDLTGSVNAGLMLSQAFYWANRTTDPEGWFWKTQQQWLDETGIPIPDQNDARELLRRTTFWREDFKGSPPKLYFQVDLEELAKAMECRVRPITLDECLALYKTNLTGMAKAGLMRAKKAKQGTLAAYVNYADLLRAKGMHCTVCNADIVRGPGQQPDCLAFDYVVPFADGGRHEIGNIIPVHTRCKGEKSEDFDDVQLSDAKRDELSDGKKVQLSDAKRDELSDDQGVNSLTVRKLNPLTVRKFSYRTETTSETTAKNTAQRGNSEQPNQLLPILLEAYKAIAKSQRELMQLRNESESLHGEGVTPDQLTAWLESSGTYPAPAFIGQTYRRWNDARLRQREKEIRVSMVGASPERIEQRLRELRGVTVESRPADTVAPSKVTVPQVADTTAWADVCRQIEARINPESFTTWFRPTSGIGYDGSTLLVRVPDRVFEDWILNNYADLLEECMPEQITAIQFVTTAEEAQAA